MLLIQVYCACQCKFFHKHHCLTPFFFFCRNFNITTLLCMEQHLCPVLSRCFTYCYLLLLHLMSLTCSLHVCLNCQTVLRSQISVLVDQLLVIFWVSAWLHSTYTQKKSGSFSARLPDMFSHSLYTLICIYFHFELDCYFLS
jgi:hypothetical protein